MTALVQDVAAGRGRGWLAVAAAYLVAGGVALAVGYALVGWHPLWKVAAADLAATVVVFAFSVVFDNSSLYDPYWSVAPIPIAVYLALAGGLAAAPSVRSIVVVGLVTWWGLRLTYNWLRRWSGLGHEDWRYRDIRRRSGRGYWPASFFAIHLFPTLLVYLGCLSLAPALRLGARPFGLLDAVAVGVTVGAIWLESAADRQLHRFLSQRTSGERLLTSGLWAICRHPNYLGEVLFWWGLFLFGLAADASWWWTVVGPVAITLLFVFISVPLIDRRMLRTKPGYAERVRTTPALLPLPRRRRP